MLFVHTCILELGAVSSLEWSEQTTCKGNFGKLLGLCIFLRHKQWATLHYQTKSDKNLNAWLEYEANFESVEWYVVMLIYGIN